MSSTPVTPKPATPAPSVVTEVKNDLAWVRTHAIIILCTLALIAGIVLGTVNLIERIEEKHDVAVAAVVP